MEFQAHGDGNVWLEGNIVFARLSGTWNKEAATQFEQQFHQVADPLCNRPWAHLVYLEDWDLCSPDMFPVIERLVSWCIDNGLVRAAQIYPPSIMKQQFVDIMVVEQLGKFERRAFDNDTDGLNWLRREGFTRDTFAD